MINHINDYLKVNVEKNNELAKCPTRPKSGSFINNFGQTVDVKISPNLALDGSIASGITKDDNNQVKNLKSALSEFVNDYFKGVELEYREDLITKMMNSTRCTENSPKWPFEIDIEQAKGTIEYLMNSSEAFQIETKMTKQEMELNKEFIDNGNFRIVGKESLKLIQATFLQKWRRFTEAVPFNGYNVLPS